MRKIIIIIVIAVLIWLGYSSTKPRQAPTINNNAAPTSTVTTNIEERSAIFVPDWNLQKNTTLIGDYDRWIYFGSKEKITSISRSWDTRKGEIWYTVKINDIPDRSTWKKKVQEIIDIANNYKLTGIVLDLEISGLPTDSTVKQINEFVEYYYTQVKQYYIKLAVAVYGDTFYRRRPYDLRFINQYSDEVMVMAYDFHKSRGEPGPNYQFDKGSRYDYDFQMMINDFLQYVPPEKLTVVFGMFGYDWSVDEKKRPIAPAKALSLNEVKNKFLDKCEWKDCIIKRDDVSRETEINYTVSSTTPDEENFYRIDYHIVWFEDEKSVEIKRQYLKKKGIGSIAYWAYGYF